LRERRKRSYKIEGGQGESVFLKTIVDLLSSITILRARLHLSGVKKPGGTIVVLKKERNQSRKLRKGE